MILPKDKYQLMGSKQQISSCKYPNTIYFVMQHCFPFYLCLTPLYTDAHMISWIPMELWKNLHKRGDKMPKHKQVSTPNAALFICQISTFCS